jgi:hypothetical protein
MTPTRGGGGGHWFLGHAVEAQEAISTFVPELT